MMLHNIQAIVLAAGKSSRFNTHKTKLIEKICGQELVLYPIKLLQSMHIPVTVIVGHQKELVQEVITRACGNSVMYITQSEQHGTAHAIASSQDSWHQDSILILHGDTPLITREIIEDLYQKHSSSHAELSFVIAHNADPSLTGYDRISNESNRIVLHPAAHGPNDMCCVNAGIYLVKRNFLESIIHQLELCETNKECTFADIISVANRRSAHIATSVAPFDRIRGINTFEQLWTAEHIKRAELIKQWMEHGVKFSLPQSVHIDLGVTIGKGTLIGCGVHLRGTSSLGENCTVHEFSSLENVTMGQAVVVNSHSVIKDSYLGNNSCIGPFAHVREQTIIQDGAMVGNFVEMKKTTFGTHSKAKHLTYLGDAHVGSQVNIGAGTITANHNGTTKQATHIEDNAYIGTHTTLIAPVTVHANAFIAAGSVITEDVPANALAIARSRQINKEGYAEVLRNKQESPPAPTTAFVAAKKTINDANNEQ